MRLTLGSRTYDLASRALVLGVAGADAAGADLVERAGTAPVPLCLAAGDDAGVERALAAGADLVRLTAPTVAALRRCAAAGVSVLVPAGAVVEATAAGLPADRIVPDTLLVDVTAAPCPTAATAAGVVRGARIVRTADVRGARPVCDVLAAVMEAR